MNQPEVVVYGLNDAHPGAAYTVVYNVSKNDVVDDDADDDVDDGADRPLHWSYLPLALVPLWILSGNCLVLLAVLRQRSLRTLSNWVIASLAFTDFLLALLVVPLGVYQLVKYTVSCYYRL